MLHNYIYLFVRKDLTPAQQTIQVAHATFEMALRSPFVSTPNAVLIGVENLEELLELGQYLRDKDIKFEMFYEPDINQHTAIATYPLIGAERQALAEFETMR